MHLAGLRLHGAREKWEMQTGSRFPGLRRESAHEMKAIDSEALYIPRGGIAQG